MVINWVIWIQWGVVAFNVGSGGWNLLNLWRVAKLNNDVKQVLKKIDKKYQESIELFQQMQIAKVKLLTYCEKCKALIKLKQ